MARHGPMMIEPWLDYFDHRGEVIELTTVEGRMRESLELLFTAHSLSFDAETQFSLAKRLSFVGEPHSKTFRSRPLEQVISENVAGGCRKQGL